jgi:hypothetical protein
MPNNTSVYLSDDLIAAISASGRSIPDLIRAGLETAPGERESGASEGEDEPREQEPREQEVWLAGVVAELINKLNDGYVLMPRKQ